jgi:hypothetical protein
VCDARAEDEQPRENVMRYETEGMAEIRRRMVAVGYKDEEVDTFKRILTELETKGFRLVKEN